MAGLDGVDWWSPTSRKGGPVPVSPGHPSREGHLSSVGWARARTHGRRRGAFVCRSSWSPCMPLRIDHVGIACSDLARSLEFYTSLLEGTAEQRAGHTVITAGALRLALVPRETDAPRATDRGHHLALRAPSEDRPALLARLLALGAHWEDVRGRVYTLDPDGFVLEFLFE